MKYCGCGNIATEELNFPNVDEFKGRKTPKWEPYCDEHANEAFENAEDHNSYQINIESGGPVIVNSRKIV